MALPEARKPVHHHEVLVEGASGLVVLPASRSRPCSRPSESQRLPGRGRSSRAPAWVVGPPTPHRGAGRVTRPTSAAAGPTLAAAVATVASPSPLPADAAAPSRPAPTASPARPTASLAAAAEAGDDLAPGSATPGAGAPADSAEGGVVGALANPPPKRDLVDLARRFKVRPGTPIRRVATAAPAVRIGESRQFWVCSTAPTSATSGSRARGSSAPSTSTSTSTRPSGSTATRSAGRSRRSSRRSCRSRRGPPRGQARAARPPAHRDPEHAPARSGGRWPMQLGRRASALGRAVLVLEQPLIAMSLGAVQPGKRPASTSASPTSSSTYCSGASTRPRTPGSTRAPPSWRSARSGSTRAATTRRSCSSRTLSSTTGPRRSARRRLALTAPPSCSSATPRTLRRLPRRRRDTWPVPSGASPAVEAALGRAASGFDFAARLRRLDGRELGRPARLGRPRHGLHGRAAGAGARPAGCGSRPGLTATLHQFAGCDFAGLLGATGTIVLETPRETQAGRGPGTAAPHLVVESLRQRRQPPDPRGRPRAGRAGRPRFAGLVRPRARLRLRLRGCLDQTAGRPGRPCRAGTPAPATRPARTAASGSPAGAAPGRAGRRVGRPDARAPGSGSCRGSRP